MTLISRIQLVVHSERVESTGQCIHSAPSGTSGGILRSFGSSQDTPLREATGDEYEVVTPDAAEGGD